MPRRLPSHRMETDQGWLLLIVALLLATGVSTSRAGDVALDGKLGLGGLLSGPNYNITVDLGCTVGNNFFYSFAWFNLDASDVATFSGSVNI